MLGGGSRIDAYVNVIQMARNAMQPVTTVKPA